METGFVIMNSAVGALFLCIDTQRCLFLLRSGKQRNTWGLVGGKCNPGERTLTSLHRECQEEIGNIPAYTRLIPLETFTSTDLKFQYNTFVCTVKKEFVPILNHEHHGYCWVRIGDYPRPLHPGLWNTINFPAIKKKIEIIQELCTDSQFNVLPHIEIQPTVQ